MRLVRPLGTNAALVLDDGIERIVTGRGVAWGLHSGEAIDSARVEKVFSLSSDSLSSKFQQVVSDMPPEELRAVEDVVREVRTSLGRPVSEAIYVSLADHIHHAISNMRLGIAVPCGLLLEIRRFYPQEWELGLRALELVRDACGTALPVDEAGFVALHIVNAEMGDEETSRRALRATRLIEEMLEIVRGTVGLDIEEDSLAHYRLINHLRHFSQRLLGGATFSGREQDAELLGVLAARYPEAHACANAIALMVRRHYATDIGSEELLYLTIHIEHALQAT